MTQSSDPDTQRVSCFKSATSKSPYKTSTLGEIFNEIATHKIPLQDKIRALQERITAAKTEDEAKQLRKEKQILKERTTLTAFALSALFKGKRANANIAEHSGVLQVDIDHLPSNKEWLDCCSKLQKSPHIWKIWRSVSGDGIKAAALIPANVDGHKDAFRAIAAHVLELTGREIDEQCKDPARICFFSHSKVWTNTKAFPIEVVAGAARSPGNAPNGNGKSHLTAGEPEPKLEASVRELAESLLGALSEWQKDERGRTFAWCRCPDVSREHHYEEQPNTRVYLNSGGVPRIECRHGECAGAVAGRNRILRTIFLDRDISQRIVELPKIEGAEEWMDKVVVLPPDVLRGILHRGGKMVLGGGAKSFKTWQQLDVCCSVASGTPWLDFPTIKGNILYLNFELPAAFCWKRIQEVCAKRKIKLPTDSFDVMNLRGYAMDIENFVPLIIEQVEQVKEYVLIVVDPIYKLLGRSRDENKAGDIAVLLNALERLAVKSGAAVLFGAHYSKGNQSEKESIDRISGSGVFGRDPDTIFNFTRHEEENCYTVESILRNHAPVAPFVVRWDFPLMSVDKELDPTLLKAMGGKGGAAGRKREYKAEDWITKVPEGELMDYGDLVDLVVNATGCGPTTAKVRLIPEAIIGKFIIKQGRKYKRASGF